MDKERIEERKIVMKQLGNNLRTLRKKRNLTQSEVAKLNGISLRSYSKYECGHAVMCVKTLFKLARFYGVTVSSLFAEEAKI